MAGVTVPEVTTRLLRYLSRQTGLADFENWFVAHTWDVERSGDAALQDLTWAIMGPLSEYQSDCLSEQELRRMLAQAYRDALLASAKLGLSRLHFANVVVRGIVDASNLITTGALGAINQPGLQDEWEVGSRSHTEEPGILGSAETAMYGLRPTAEALGFRGLTHLVAIEGWPTPLARRNSVERPVGTL